MVEEVTKRPGETVAFSYFRIIFSMEENNSTQKRIEELENQVFAQKLLIDELEKKMEEFQRAWTNWMSPKLGYTIPIKYTSVPACSHPSWQADFFGNLCCSSCGQVNLASVKVTCENEQL